MADLANFKQYCASQGLSVLKVRDDGNCLFRAVAALVYGQEERHPIVRKLVVDTLVKYGVEYEPFIVEGYNLKSYCEKMSKSGAWGGNLELMIVSRLYKRKVLIYQQTGQLITVCDWSLDEDSVDCVRLSYHNNQHYNALLAADQVKTLSQTQVEPLSMSDISGAGIDAHIPVLNWQPSEAEQTVINATQCTDQALLKSLLVYLDGDISMTVRCVKWEMRRRREKVLAQQLQNKALSQLQEEKNGIPNRCVEAKLGKNKFKLTKSIFGRRRPLSQR